MINALQDLYVDDDLSVKTADGSLVQTKYGGDAVDPMRSKEV